MKLMPWRVGCWAKRLAWLSICLSLAVPLGCAKTLAGPAGPAAGAASPAQGTKTPPGAPLTAAQMAAVRDLMARAQAPCQAVSATAKMTRFGPDGRLKVTLQLVLQRPNMFRLTVLGPHGPPVYAAACDGAQLTALDVGKKTLRSQPATAAGIAYHLGGLDLGLTAADWVQLFFREMTIPAEAQASRAQDRGPKGASAVTWLWRTGGRQVAAVVDGASGVLLSATITLGDGRIGTVHLEGRGPTGVAERNALHLSAAGKEGAQDVELTLQDVAQLQGPIDDGAFVLAAPAVPTL